MFPFILYLQTMKQIIDVNEINTEAFVLLAPKPVSDITLVVVPGTNSICISS
jgi:hypothetical protein